MAHHRETAEQSLYHAGNGVPCRFFNKDTRFDFATNQYLPGCVNGAACPYSHAPTIQSLRLDLFGPNICEGHLVRVGGCPFGPSCVHSHDLERSAALPVDDRDALRATLEYFVRLRKDQRRGLGVRGSVIKAWGGGAPVVQMRGKCGDAILRELGGSRPGDQNADNPTPTTSTFTSRSSFLQTGTPAIQVWRLADEVSSSPSSPPVASASSYPTPPHTDLPRVQKEKLRMQVEAHKTSRGKGKGKAEILAPPSTRIATRVVAAATEVPDDDLPPPPPEPYRQEDLDGEDLIRGGHDGEPSEDPGYQR